MRRLLTAALMMALAPAVQAQDYPSRTIRIIVPFAAGGAVDAVARTMARHLAEKFKQQVYVENRAGASGNIGAEQVVQSPPDGTTLLVSASTLVVNPVVSARTCVVRSAEGSVAAWIDRQGAGAVHCQSAGGVERAGVRHQGEGASGVVQLRDRRLRLGRTYVGGVLQTARGPQHSGRALQGAPGRRSTISSAATSAASWTPC